MSQSNQPFLDHPGIEPRASLLVGKRYTEQLLEVINNKQRTNLKNGAATKDSEKFLRIGFQWKNGVAGPRFERGTPAPETGALPMGYHLLTTKTLFRPLFNIF